MIPIVDPPTDRTAVLWDWFRRADRVIASALNRLQVHNFDPASGFSLAKRANQYAENEYGYGQKDTPATRVAATVIFDQPPGAGEITFGGLEVANTLGAGESIVAEFYRAGVLVQTLTLGAGDFVQSWSPGAGTQAFTAGQAIRVDLSYTIGGTPRKPLLRVTLKTKTPLLTV